MLLAIMHSIAHLSPIVGGCKQRAKLTGLINEALKNPGKTIKFRKLIQCARSILEPIRLLS